MAVAPVQPNDLLFAPDDPFEALDGHDPAWPYRTLSLVDPRILVVRVFETPVLDDAEAEALKLGRRLAEGGYRGLIIDYRTAGIDHGPGDFSTLADALARAFPADLRVVYLHDADTFVIARLMVQLMRDRRVRAARVKSFDAAWMAITA